jgi:hypothetical protein
MLHPMRIRAPRMAGYLVKVTTLTRSVPDSSTICMPLMHTRDYLQRRVYSHGSRSATLAGHGELCGRLPG